MTGHDLRDLLARRGLHLSRERGQNFLVDDMLARHLVEKSQIDSEDAVLEVGTGLGTLTRALAERAHHVLTLEIDAGLVRALREEALLPENVELRHADVLDIDFGATLEALEAKRGGPSGRLCLVANLPYSVATPLLRVLLDQRERLGAWSVMLQREVAERLSAEVGTRGYGSFAVLHRLLTTVEHLVALGPRQFFPRPRVESVFVRVTPRVDSPVAAGELRSLERVTRAAFATRRKTIQNALRGGGFAPERVASALRAAKIDPRARAEVVAPERFLVLCRDLAEEESSRGAD